MHVNTYDEVFTEAFRRAVENLTETQTAEVEKHIKELHERVVERMHYDIVDYMVSNIADTISQRAAEVAEKMIQAAIAGDDSTIKNLFGFQYDYNAQLHIWGEPTQWKLIDAIVARNPQLFVDERFKQLEAEVVQLKKDLERNRAYCATNHDKEDMPF